LFILFLLFCVYHFKTINLYLNQTQTQTFNAREHKQRREKKTMEVSNNQEDETDNKDDAVVVVQEENETITKKDSDNATGDVVENNKRPKRLSKQQRKALNKKNKKRKQDNTSNSNSNEEEKNLDSSKVTVPNDGKNDDDIDIDIDTDIEAAEERIRIECMKSYDPIDIPKEPSKDLVSHGHAKNNNSATTAKTTTTVADGETGGVRTLGKWFPNAILIKSSISYTNTGKLIPVKGSDNENNQHQQVVENPKSSLVLFYQYTTSNNAGDNDNDNDNGDGKNKMWDRRQLQLLITFLSTIARHRNLGGRIRVAPEGVNATLSAVDTTHCTAKAALRHFAEDLKRFDSRVFSTNTDFKYFDELPADRHFTEFKFLPVQELVFYDIGEDEAPLTNTKDNNNNTNNKNNDGGAGGTHLDARDFNKMLQKDNTVVIDVRNHYEAILGRFDGQNQQKKSILKSKSSKGKSENNNDDSTTTTTGAEYIDPKMRKSTDFKSWLNTKETREKLKNKTVMMYCTGGIRCERASAYLKSQMGNDVEGVYQLQGGVERYLKTFKDGGFWRGKNFVFDKREAVSVDNPHGDGGVIRKQDMKKQKKQQKQKNNESNSNNLPAKCCVCGDAWDRYIGKKKCSTCGVPVLMCVKCMSLKLDKTPGKELMVRCPLCVEENITVLAKEVEFTNNGIKNKAVQKPVTLDECHGGKTLTVTNGDSCDGEPIVTENEDKDEAPGKAADTVLKWGGGHANKKKERKEKKKMKRRLCQFGTECVRKDCFFHHPERESNSKKNKTGAK
jgi:predicted sulfurtransferase